MKNIIGVVKELFELVGLLIEVFLLSIAYIIGIGFSSALLWKKKRKSGWIKSNLGGKPKKHYYRQF